MSLLKFGSSTFLQQSPELNYMFMEKPCLAVQNFSLRLHSSSLPPLASGQRSGSSCSPFSGPRLILCIILIRPLLSLLPTVSNSPGVWSHTHAGFNGGSLPSSWSFIWLCSKPCVCLPFFHKLFENVSWIVRFFFSIFVVLPSINFLVVVHYSWIIKSELLIQHLIFKCSEEERTISQGIIYYKAFWFGDEFFLLALAIRA